MAIDSQTLVDWIAGGEGSTVEFKRDDVDSKKLAKEIVALLNSHGGMLLLGVEDNGNISGLVHAAKKAEERIFNICANGIEPAVIPQWDTVRVNGKYVGVLTLPPDSAHKPYRTKQNGKYYLRAGSVSRECTREELGRLFATSPVGESYISKAVLNTQFSDIDVRRLHDYAAIRSITPPDQDNDAGWHHLLVNLELMTADGYLTVAGVLLFAAEPRRLLKQAGITAVAYVGTEREGAARERARLPLPLTPLLSTGGQSQRPLEAGLADEAIHFIQRNTGVHEEQVGGRLESRPEMPPDVLREVMINALVHRDYSMHSDVMLEIFSDRVVVTSPGVFLNSMTIERMKSGVRAVRNQLLVDIMQDYNYMEGTGRGISRIVIPSMRKHNLPEPEFTLADNQFVVTLRRVPPVALG